MHAGENPVSATFYLDFGFSCGQNVFTDSQNEEGLSHCLATTESIAPTTLDRIVESQATEASQLFQQTVSESCDHWGE